MSDITEKSPDLTALMLTAQEGGEGITPPPHRNVLAIPRDRWARYRLQVPQEGGPPKFCALGWLSAYESGDTGTRNQAEIALTIPTGIRARSKDAAQHQLAIARANDLPEEPQREKELRHELHQVGVDLVLVDRFEEIAPYMAAWKRGPHGA